MFRFFINLNESVPSITDWLQVIISLVGLITIYWVYRTFKLQQNTFIEQQKITEIEQKRYIAEIRPDVSFTIDWQNDKVRIVPINREVRRATFMISNVVPQITFKTQLDKLEPTDLPLGFPTEFKFDVSGSIEESEEIFRFFICYEDEIGTEYIKSCACFFMRPNVPMYGPRTLNDRSFTSSDPQTPDQTI